MARKSDWDFSVSGLSEAPWKNYVTRPTASGGAYTVPLAESPQMEMERPPALNVLRPVADAATSVMGTPVAPSAPVGPQINVVPPMQPAPSAPATPFQQALADERAWNDRARANAIRAGIRVSNMTPEEEQTALEETQRRTYDTRQQEAIGARLATLRDVTTKRAQAQVEAGLQAEGFTPAEIEWYSQASPQDQRKLLAQVRTDKARGLRQEAGFAQQEKMAGIQQQNRVALQQGAQEFQAARDATAQDAAMERTLTQIAGNYGLARNKAEWDRKTNREKFQFVAEEAAKRRDFETQRDINQLAGQAWLAGYRGEVQGAVRAFEKPPPPPAQLPQFGTARAQTAGAQATGVPTGTTLPDVTGDGRPETKAQIDEAVSTVRKYPPEQIEALRKAGRVTDAQYEKYLDQKAIYDAYEAKRKQRAKELVGI